MKLRLLLLGCLAVLSAADNSLQKRAIDSAPRISKKSEIVEGSGDPPKSKAAAAHPDLELHGSGNGYSPDDEDGDDVHGSGTPSSDVVEGSGRAPSVIPRPQLTTTTTTTQSPQREQKRPDETTKGTTTTTHAVLHPIEKLSEADDDSIDESDPSVVVQENTTRQPQVPSVTTTTRSTPSDTDTQSPFQHMLKPGIFAAVVGGTVVGLLTAVLLVMFIIHRMRKKDEGSYALDEPKPRPYAGYTYQKAATKEFYA